MWRFYSRSSTFMDPTTVTIATATAATAIITTSNGWALMHYEYWLGCLVAVVNQLIVEIGHLSNEEKKLLTSNYMLSLNELMSRSYLNTQKSSREIFLTSYHYCVVIYHARHDSDVLSTPQTSRADLSFLVQIPHPSLQVAAWLCPKIAALESNTKFAELRWRVTSFLLWFRLEYSSISIL